MQSIWGKNNFQVELASFMCKTIKRKLTQFTFFYLSKCYETVMFCVTSDRLPRTCESNAVVMKSYILSVERNILSNGTVFCACQKSKVHSALLVGAIIEKTQGIVGKNRRTCTKGPQSRSNALAPIYVWTEYSAFIITDYDQTLTSATVSIQTHNKCVSE